MRKILYLAVVLVMGLLPALAAAEETYKLDLAEIEKKPTHFSGYVEFKPLLFGLDQDAAFYKLRYFGAPQGQTLFEANSRVQLVGSYEQEGYRLYARTNTELKYASASGSSERSVFQEAYASLKPSSALRIDVGKKTLKWGKGYAWNPAAFVDRPKDPDDPELALEGFVVASTDVIRSFDGPLKTFSFTPVLLPVYDHVNDAFGNNNHLNFAGRFYFLLYDTDIDLMFMTGGSRTDRYGADFSRNITTSFEIHGEYAYLRNSRKTVLDPIGNTKQVETDTHNYLIGIRHLTGFDLTTIVEIYHNGTGFTGDELTNFFAFVNRAYNIHQTSGNAVPLANAGNLAEGAYGRFSTGKDYLYVRLSQKEPLDILYFTPALTFITNLDDRSYTLTPELLYTGFTNWEMRFRTAFIAGGKNTEFGEKQNDFRMELRIGYYF